MDTGLLIQELQTEALRIVQRDEEKVHALKLRARMIIGKVFGPSSNYLKELENIHFNPSVVSIGMEDMAFEAAWQQGKSQFVNLCRTMIDDLHLSTARTPDQPSEAKPKANLSDRIFIVHGHDDYMKSAVARVVGELGLKPVILHEQADEGRTVIEKFVAHSDVGFAVVLLSGDDMAYPKSSKPKGARPRARQNVILELGFFVGKLGRNRVLPLFRKADDFELPSDYAGVLYKEFDETGAWRFALAQELKAAGYSVDANKLM